MESHNELLQEVHALGERPPVTLDQRRLRPTTSSDRSEPALAQDLRVDLGKRSVRAALVDELGATRVELGAAAEKKGLLSFFGAASMAKLAKGRPINGVLKLRKRTGETMP